MERNDLLSELLIFNMDVMILIFSVGHSVCAEILLKSFPHRYEEQCIRIEFFGEEIDRIREIDALTGEVLSERKHVAIFPASHFVTGEEKMKIAIKNIENELEERLNNLNDEGKLLEAQRIEQRTRYDLEMMARWDSVQVSKTIQDHFLFVSGSNAIRFLISSQMTGY